MILTCFSPLYAANTPTASMRKLQLVAEAAGAAGLVELIDPDTIDPDKLRKLHAPKFVDSFLSGEEPLWPHAKGGSKRLKFGMAFWPSTPAKSRPPNWRLSMA